MKLYTSIITAIVSSLAGAIGIGALLALQLAPRVELPQVNTNAEVGRRTPCTLVVRTAATVYDRPSLGAAVFGTIGPSERVVIGGRTADGWLGFDPGVAQAPNVGPFRLRWVAPTTPLTLAGTCRSLPMVAKIPPHLCFTMAQADMAIHKEAASTSPVVATMHFGDYIQVVARAGTSAKAWVQVESPLGTLPPGTKGWISLDDVNFNGDCDKLPAP